MASGVGTLAHGLRPTATTVTPGGGAGLADGLVVGDGPGRAVGPPSHAARTAATTTVVGTATSLRNLMDATLGGAPAGGFHILARLPGAAPRWRTRLGGAPNEAVKQVVKCPWLAKPSSYAICARSWHRSRTRSTEARSRVSVRYRCSGTPVTARNVRVRWYGETCTAAASVARLTRRPGSAAMRALTCSTSSRRAWAPAAERAGGRRGGYAAPTASASTR